MTTEHNEQQPAAAQEAVYYAPWTGTPGRIDENGVEWRPVVGFEQFYEVSSEGRIFSLRHKRLLSNNSMASHGYIKAFFHGDGKRCQTFAHRAVAEAFLGPAEGREVNHLNGIRTDNRVENLDWVTRSENEIHSRYILGNLCEAVIAVSLRTGARVIFRSQGEAEAELCLPRDAVRRCLVGDFKSSMGWTFEKPADSLAPVTAAPADAEEDAYVIGQTTKLLAEIAVIVNGPEPAGTRWSYHDLPAKVRALAGTPAAPADTWFADQLAAMGEVIPLDSTPAAPGIDLRQFRDAVDALLPFAEHHESCGDHDAYNNASIPTCGCGLESARGRLLALIDASPKGAAPRFELTNGQIAQLFNFGGTPRAGTLLDDQDVLVIQHTDTGHSGPGLYAHYEDMPEEGAIYLDGQLPDSPKGGSEARDGEVRIWGIEKPGSIPKLLGVRHIAELNWYPDEGYDLICMQVVERVKASDAEVRP